MTHYLTCSPVKQSAKRAGLGFEPPSRRQMKPFMENAPAHQKHKPLLIGNACALIHGMQAVQKTFDFYLIEVRNRGKNRPARTVPCTNGRNHSWRVGKPYLTGLRKVSPSLGNKVDFQCGNHLSQEERDYGIPIRERPRTMWFCGRLRIWTLEDGTRCGCAPCISSADRPRVSP